MPRRRCLCLCRILLSNAGPHPYMGKSRARGCCAVRPLPRSVNNIPANTGMWKTFQLSG